MNKLFFTFLITSFFISGCGQSKTRTAAASKIDKSIGAYTAPEKRDLLVDERTIGDRICKAFEFKRLKMEKLENMVEKFQFSGQWKACGETVVALAPYDSAISKIDGELAYVPEVAGTKSFSDVLTDKSEPFPTLCSNINSAATVSNLITNNGVNYYFKIYNISGTDTFELSKVAKNSKGQFSLVEIQVVSVITSKTPNLDTRLLGIEQSRTVNSTCTGSKDYKSLTQTWLSASSTY